MDIFGYGEDAFTMWALKNRLSVLLEKLNDTSTLSQCKAFFRPSFGRGGGDNKAQFGEFDFILLSQHRLYLGESKWHRSSEKITNGILQLRQEQLNRHAIFKFYAQEWAFGNYSTWNDFVESAKVKLQGNENSKPIAPDGSLLASNLKTLLQVIRQHFTIQPPMQNVLLFLHDGTYKKPPLQGAGLDFKVVTIDCSEGCYENFIKL